MIKKLIAFLARRERFTEGAAVLTLTTFGSYVMGLIRDRTFARTFGAGRELDLYNASFIIPDLLLMILVSSVLSAAFIPMFTGLRAQHKEDEANNLANTILHTATFAICIFAIVIAFLMPALAPMLVPGFSGAEQIELVKLSRLMLFSPVMIALSSSLGAMLVSFRRFLAYGISPILYNGGIILGALLAPKFGVYGLLAGTLFGASLHVLPRLIAIIRTPYKYKFFISLRDANFIRVIKLALPKMIGHPVEQLTFLAFTSAASLLAAGSVASVSFARNFQSVAISLFGIAFSVAIYPTLAEAAAKGDRAQFLKNFWKALKDILIFAIPAAIGLYFLSDLPIRIFLGGGKFTNENILRTAGVLSVFALSIPTESVVPLLARSFYALKNTVIPVTFSVVSLIISASFAYLRAPEIGISAIPLGFFLGSITEALLLALFLRRKLQSSLFAPK